MKRTFILLVLFFILFDIQYSLPFFNNDFKADNATKTKKIYIFGHKSPDTDTISSSIALADYLKRLGNSNDIIPCRLGDLNKETKYVLDYFKVESPKLISNLSEADEIILVDHNEPSQSLDSENANYAGLIDHHAISGFITTSPVKVIANGVGSTCTIIYELYKENKISIPNEIAGLMLSAIISDTLLLKSSTTTNEDVVAVQYLSEIAGVNYTKYGYDMLLAGTNVSDYSENDIITIDSKAYTVNGYPIQIASIQCVNTTQILNRKAKLLEEMDKYNKDKKKELFVLSIVDIINMDSILLVKGNLSTSVEKAFNSNQLSLKGKTPRKKEIYPPIAKAINELPEFEGNPSSEGSESPGNSSTSDNEIFDRYNANSDLSKNIRFNILLVLTLLFI